MQHTLSDITFSQLPMLNSRPDYNIKQQRFETFESVQTFLARIGITLTLLAFSWVNIAPPYHFTENVPDVFRMMIPLIIATAGTVLNTMLTKKVMLIVGWVGGFDALWVHVAVLLAALPPAAGVLGYAQQYGIYAERAGAAILLATVISIATVTIVLILLLSNVLPIDPFR